MSEDLANDLHTIISNDYGLYQGYMSTIENILQNEESEDDPDVVKARRAKEVGEAIRDDWMELMNLDTNSLAYTFLEEYFRQMDWAALGELCLSDYEDENA